MKMRENARRNPGFEAVPFRTGPWLRFSGDSLEAAVAGKPPGGPEVMDATSVKLHLNPPRKTVPVETHKPLSVFTPELFSPARRAG